MAHERIVCECGQVIASCGYIEGAQHTRVVSPCIHVKHVSMDRKPSDQETRHIIDSGDGIPIHTNDGLAFTIGVAVMEAELRRDTATLYRVQHPNGVDLYHVAFMPSGEVITRKVGT